MRWEVRTMRFGTSFFNGTLYKKTTLRFWPIWVINLLIWMMAIPLHGLLNLQNAGPYFDLKAYMDSFALSVGRLGTQDAMLFALVAGVIVAMAVCSHLYSARSANFMGVLPVRREGQFVSHYLSGLTMLIGPNVVVFLCTFLFQVAMGSTQFGPLLFWLASLSAMELFFYSFAVCVGMFVGHILVLPVFYGIFNGLVIATYMLVVTVMRVFYFGFSDFPAWLSDAVLWLTPLLKLGDSLSFDSGWDPAGTLVYRIEGGTTLGVYAVVAVVLAVCALLLYRRRHLESAGDVVAVRVMRPVFKYCVSVCAGLFLGMLTVAMLGLGTTGMMIAMVVWAVVGYFVAQMLLDKTVRVFRKWKGAAVVAAVLVLLFAVVNFDLTGYEKRIPRTEQVASVTVSGLHASPYDDGNRLFGAKISDPDAIARIIALHEAVVDFGPEGETDGVTWISFEVRYTLRSGATFTRDYYVQAGDTLLGLAQEVIDQPSVREAAYGLDELAAQRGLGAELRAASLSGDPDWFGDDAQRLWDAVMADFEAGRIGIHAMGSDYPVAEPWDDPMPQIERLDQQLTFQWERSNAWKRSISFELLGTSTETLAALAELGVEIVR